MLSLMNLTVMMKQISNVDCAGMCVRIILLIVYSQGYHTVLIYKIFLNYKGDCRKLPCTYF